VDAAVIEHIEIAALVGVRHPLLGPQEILPAAIIGMPIEENRIAAIRCVRRRSLAVGCWPLLLAFSVMWSIQVRSSCDSV